MLHIIAVIGLLNHIVAQKKVIHCLIVSLLQHIVAVLPRGLKYVHPFRSKKNRLLPALHRPYAQD